MTMHPHSHLMRGGFDLVTPAIAAVPGRLMGGVNYEPEARGYRRVFGYERYDGQPRPSAASYWVLNFDAGTAAITEGQTVTGLTSGATGKALIDAVVTSGSYGGADAAGYLVLTVVSGTFQNNENLQVAAVTKSVANGVTAERGALTDANDTLWYRDAVATARALIQKPAGEGPVRGSFVLNGVKHCIRNNVGSTAGVLFKATAAGWVAQDLGKHLLFIAATAAFPEGATVTGGTSGATGVVRRAVLQTGTWGAGTGLLTLSGIVGAFVNAEAITGGGGAATVSGTLVTNALPAGGHYDYTIHNFYGSAYSPRAYLAGGVGYAFEWDGTYFTPIHTGLGVTLDKPTHVSELSNHLFLGYSTGEMINSEIGVPVQFKTAAGALSYSFGAKITNMSKGESTAMIVCGRSQIGYVFGNDSSDFQLKPISGDAGAIEWTLVSAGSPTYMDEAGIRRVQSTDSFGGWRAGTLTDAVEPLFQAKQVAMVSAACSMRVRKKDLYRLFFDDGTGLTLYLGRKVPEVIPFELEHVAFCACEGIIGSDSEESAFIGTDDGYVMELDHGTSFDGASILAWARLVPNHLGAPAQNKRFHLAIIECDVEGLASLSIMAEYSHGSASLPVTAEQALSVNAGGGVWNEALWNQFNWSAQLVGEATAFVPGLGHNAIYTILSETAYENPHILKAMTIHYSPRGMRRGGA